MKISKIFVSIALAIVFTCLILPCQAKINGNVSKSTYFDSEKTIMSEVTPAKSFKTAKYWDKNLFYPFKYRPLFMLSNKELIDLMPKEEVSVVNIIAAPSVYNISLKSASIKTVSLARANLEVKQTVAKATSKPAAQVFVDSLYEDAKNSLDMEVKVDTAITLKNIRTAANYKLAMNLLDEVTAKEPFNAYAFCLKGEIFAAQKSYESAMRNYVEALKINPLSKQSCLGIAKILEPTNKELAMKYYAMAK